MTFFKDIAFYPLDRLVTTNSRIEFRIYGNRSFKSNSELGHCLIFLNKLMLETNNPQCKIN